MEANLGTIVSLCRWVVGPQAAGQGRLGPRARTGRPRLGGQEPSVAFPGTGPRRGVGDWAGPPGHGQHVNTSHLSGLQSASCLSTPGASLWPLRQADHR